MSSNDNYDDDFDGEDDEYDYFQPGEVDFDCTPRHESGCECSSCESAGGRDIAIRRAEETDEGWEDL